VIRNPVDVNERRLYAAAAEPALGGHKAYLDSSTLARDAQGRSWSFHLSVVMLQNVQRMVTQEGEATATPDRNCSYERAFLARIHRRVELYLLERE